MAKIIQQSDTEKVSLFISKLDPSIVPVVEAIRRTILESSTFIAEQIKWNNPAFYYTGHMQPFDPKTYKRDIAVFNLLKGRIMLVLPHGAGLDDPDGLLDGEYKNGRRLIYFKNLEDLSSKSASLSTLMKVWVKRAASDNDQ